MYLVDTDVISEPIPRGMTFSVRMYRSVIFE
jgi:hypothetical protein